LNKFEINQTYLNPAAHRSALSPSSPARGPTPSRSHWSPSLPFFSPSTTGPHSLGGPPASFASLSLSLPGTPCARRPPGTAVLGKGPPLPHTPHYGRTPPPLFLHTPPSRSPSSPSFLFFPRAPFPLLLHGASPSSPRPHQPRSRLSRYRAAGAVHVMPTAASASSVSATTLPPWRHATSF
jgi:hypothetical protein